MLSIVLLLLLTMIVVVDVVVVVAVIVFICIIVVILIHPLLICLSLLSLLQLVYDFTIEKEEVKIDCVRRIVFVLSTIGYPSTRIHTYHHPCPACSVHPCPPPVLSPVVASVFIFLIILFLFL